MLQAILTDERVGYQSARPPRTVKTVAEFFAGIGLMRLGLERAGWEVTFANDIDPQKKAIYEGHFGPEDHFVLEDIHCLTPLEMPTVTLATASFPCTDLSLAGAREGLAGEHSGALWGFTDLLDGLGTHRPPLVLLENVVGFLTSHGGEDFHQALLRLNGLGYGVDAFIVDAVRFVPQSRQRLFVVGILNAHTTARPQESEIRPRALIHFMERHDDIRWNLRSLPPLPVPRLFLPDILEDLPEDDIHWWSVERAQYLLNQMSIRHTGMAAAMMAADHWSYGTVFRRMRNGTSMAELRTDGIAGCLRTPKGGSGRQILFKAGFGRFFVRLITPREAARLMGADEYKITVPLNQALFGFGDAVCVPVVEWIATHYLNPVVAELNVTMPVGA
jgi:DNA (cytosine-5)-methyltransferase 1